MNYKTFELYLACFKKWGSCKFVRDRLLSLLNYKTFELYLACFKKRGSCKFVRDRLLSLLKNLYLYTKSNLQSKAVSLLKYSSTFVTNRPYLKENLKTV